jgi:hypothetical protein
MKKKATKAQNAPQNIIRLPRQFRWTLRSEQHPDIENWMRFVNLDLSNRCLDIQVMEDPELKVYSWVSSFPHKRLSRDGKTPTDAFDKLILSCYDGLGKVIYALKLSHLRLIEHKCPFDYDSSDVVTHHLKVEFDYTEKLFEGDDKPNVNLAKVYN